MDENKATQHADFIGRMQVIDAMRDSIATSQKILLAATSSLIPDKVFGNKDVRQQLITIIEKEIELHNNLLNEICKNQLKLDEIVMRSFEIRNYHDENLSPIFAKSRLLREANSIIDGLLNGEL